MDGMRDTFANFPWHWLYAGLMAAVLLAGLVIAVVTIRRMKKQGVTLLRVSGGSLDPASTQTLLLAFATVVGALWIAYEFAVTGAHKFKQYQLERAKLIDTPTLDIEIGANVMGKAADPLRPVEVTVRTKNTGARTVPLDLTDVPMLSVVPVDGSSISFEDALIEPIEIEKIYHLPHLKIECEQRNPALDLTKWKPSCSLRTWSSAQLEPGGVGYYSFLHPGLPPGIYLAQFALVIKPHLVVGDFDTSRPVLWSRSKYFIVPEPAPYE